MKAAVEAAGGVWTDRRPGIERVLADVLKRKPGLSMSEAMVEAKGLYTSPTVARRVAGVMVAVPNALYLGGRAARGRVAGAQQAHPHVGTPAPASHAGNSTPVLAPVAGAQKSEQVGERGASK